MKTLIVLNQTDVEPLNEDFDFVIGVDGGCKWCIENSVNIDLAIGDFDSLEQHYLEQLDLHAKIIEQHPSHKDFTDLELAISSAISSSSQDLTVLGVWGGRTDHSLANLLCLAKQSSNIPVKMPGNEHHGYLVKSNQKITLQNADQQIISILAMLADCHGVTNDGMKYRLTDAIIKQGSGQGISNEIVSNPAGISLDKGVLLVLTDPSCEAKIINYQRE